MSAAYIRARTPVAPLLREPRAAATQESQILFGHCAEVLAREGNWYRVRGGEGYEGWVHEGFTEPAEGAECEEWGWSTAHAISLGCSVRDAGGRTLRLPLGAIVRDEACTDGRALGRAARREEFPSTAMAIVSSATRFFEGTYYQWGGITPWGADCSGMIQTAYALHGVKLMRDAWQQAGEGMELDGGLDALEPADLLFFSDSPEGRITHVAMAASRTSLVHQAIGRGGHRVESLVEPDDYVRGLLSRFRFARRVVTMAQMK